MNRNSNYLTPIVALIVLVLAERFIKLEFTNHQSVLVIAITLLAASLVYLASRFSSRTVFWESYTDQSSVKNERVLALMIIVLGFFLRLWNIWDVQGGFMWDSAYKGLDAISIREFGERPIFLDWNAGREALIAYLVAGAQMLLGTSVVAVRLVVALAGCVTLIFLYLFVRSTFNAKLALLTTFL
ncbi:MAG TPA: hypothetical protein VLH08_21130, partial [Acidobacteriota bacterium]|nr:hypothetical protein [Acidobacteriota bacterium]